MSDRLWPAVTERLRPARIRRSAVARARGLGMSARLIGYKPVAVGPVEVWEQDHRSGAVDFYADLHQLHRYAILLGYVRFIGGRPEILDFGCGSGIFRTRMEGIDFERFVGVDYAAAAIEKAKPHEDERTSFLVADQPDAVPGSFDIVVCNEVLEAVDDPAGTLDRVRHVMREGGHLLTSIWRHPGDPALHRMIDERFERLDVVEVKNVTSPALRRRWRLACHRRR